MVCTFIARKRKLHDWWSNSGLQNVKEELEQQQMEVKGLVRVIGGNSLSRDM